jgi:hypothetical protein
MIGKVCLAVICLSGLGTMVVINAGTSTPAPTSGASPEQTTVGETYSQDTLTKADKWEIAHVGDAVAIEPAMPVTKAPDETRPQPPTPTATPKIVSRHWHDPNVKKSAAISHGRRVKGQESKKSKNADPGKATVDLTACRRPEGLARLLRALNLSSRCDT